MKRARMKPAVGPEHFSSRRRFSMTRPMLSVAVLLLAACSGGKDDDGPEATATIDTDPVAITLSR